MEFLHLWYKLLNEPWGGWTNTGACLMAAFLMYSNGLPTMFWLAVIAGFIAFATHNIMRNSRMEIDDMRTIHKLFIVLNMLATLVGFGLIFIAPFVFGQRASEKSYWPLMPKW